MHRPLTPEDLLPHGALARIGRAVHLLDTASSTNEVLLRQTDPRDGAVAAAEFQTAGRGRQGRRWEAPRGSSILLSVLLIEPADSALIVHAAQLAGLAACEAVEAASECRPALRWPNDLTLAGRKLGGVLAESTPWRAGQRLLVIGVGLNCLQQRGHFGEGLEHTATSLEIESSRPIDRAAVARELLSRLDCHFALRQRDPAPLAESRAAWLARCGDLGTRATLRQDGREYTGTILDLADEGDLWLELDQGGRRRFEATSTTRLW